MNQAGPLGLPADALKGLGDAAGGAAGGPLGGLLASALGGGAATAKAAMTAKEYDLQELRKMSSAVFFEGMCVHPWHTGTRGAGDGTSFSCHHPPCSQPLRSLTTACHS